MVWIQNNSIPRQYVDSIVKARKMAIEWLDNNTQGKRYESIYFFAKRKSRIYDAYVLMENHGNGRHYSWHYYTKKYGMVSVPLYKNGKIMR